MRMIEANMHRRMPAVDAGKIGPMGGLFLMHLEQLEPCSINAMAKATGRDNSQLTRLMRTLITKGLMTRSQSDIDAREAVLRLTPAGHKFIVDAKKMMTDTINAMLHSFSADDRAMLLSLLKRI